MQRRLSKLKTTNACIYEHMLSGMRNLSGGGVREKLLEFILHANVERYYWQKENFKDLDEFVTEEDIIG